MKYYTPVDLLCRHRTVTPGKEGARFSPQKQGQGGVSSERPWSSPDLHTRARSKLLYRLTILIMLRF